MGKRTNKNPLAKFLKAFHCCMFICERLNPANFDTEECLTKDLTPSLVINREEKLKIKANIQKHQKEIYTKDLAGDKGDGLVLSFTFYHELVKVNTKLTKQINKQEKQTLPFFFWVICQWIIHLRAAPFKLLPVSAASFKGRALSGG